MATDVLVRAEEEFEAEGEAQFDACMNCGAALPNVTLVLKGPEEFVGHVMVDTRCARCDKEWATVLHFCGDADSCEIAAIERQNVEGDTVQ